MHFKFRTFLLAFPVLGVSARFQNDSSTVTHDDIKHPKTTIRNGSLNGLYLPAFDEHLFLGIPFAAPPIDDLRLRRPVPYPNSWNSTRDATIRAPSCPGYAGFDVGLVIGENCLTLDIVRPAGVTEGDRLPILVWIYGGGKIWHLFINLGFTR